METSKQKGFVVVEILAVVGVISLLILGLMLFVNFMNGQVDRQCKAQFGQEWTGKSPAYSPNMCINKEGEVKYPL